MKTKLEFILDINDVNCKYLKITDVSLYNKDTEIKTPTIRVTIPNFNKYVDIDYTPNNVTILNTKNLKISSELTCLPSGLYELRFSVCPNDKLFKIYNFFNICNELNTLYTIMESYVDNCSSCNLSNSDLKDLLNLEQLFNLSKKIVENCNETEKGIWLYNEALKQLNQFKHC